MSGDPGNRGVSEGAGMAALILLTVLVTASVGINVLFLDDEQEGVQTNFSFQYREDAGSLLVTHQKGDEISSDRVYVRGPQGEGNVTWTELAGWNESRDVTQGDIVRVGDNAYESRVGATDQIRIIYVTENGTEKELDRWEGASSGVGG